jgi:hypothetical protein
MFEKKYQYSAGDDEKYGFDYLGHCVLLSSLKSAAGTEASRLSSGSGQ